jgi:hypothetical protein
MFGQLTKSRINSHTTLHQTGTSPEQETTLQNLEVGVDTRSSFGEHFGQSETARKPFQSTRQHENQLKFIPELDEQDEIHSEDSETMLYNN